MDLHVVFKSNTTETCHVYFNHKECGGAKLEGFALNGGNTGTESLKITAGPSHYLIYAKANGGEHDPFPLGLSQARINFYSSASDAKLLSINVPYASRVQDIWLAFCYSGTKGPAGIVPLGIVRKGGAESMLDICDKVYGAPADFTGLDVEIEGNEVIYDFKSP